MASVTVTVTVTAQAVSSVLEEQHSVFVECLKKVDQRVDLRMLWETVGLRVSLFDLCSRSSSVGEGIALPCLLLAPVAGKVQPMRGEHKTLLELGLRACLFWGFDILNDNRSQRKKWVLHHECPKPYAYPRQFSAVFLAC